MYREQSMTEDPAWRCAKRIDPPYKNGVIDPPWITRYMDNDNPSW